MTGKISKILIVTKKGLALTSLFIGIYDFLRSLPESDEVLTAVVIPEGSRAVLVTKRGNIGAIAESNMIEATKGREHFYPVVKVTGEDEVVSVVIQKVV